MTQNRGQKESYHRLAPKQAILASGTLNAEHGVFFKWRRSSQVALEGSREVTVRLLVPHDWRGDWLEFHAEMLGHSRNYLGDKVEPVGEARAILALYLAGDAAAQQAAFDVAAAQADGGALIGKHPQQDPRMHTANKPVAPAEPRKSTERFAIPSLFKVCGHERKNATDTVASPLTAALENLQGLSGTLPRTALP